MEDVGGIKPIVIGGMGEVNKYFRALLQDTAEAAAESAFAKGFVKSLESGMAQYNRKITNCIGMAITKARAYRKLKGLSLCGLSPEDAGAMWDRARLTGEFRGSSTPDWLDRPANFMFLDFECKGFEDEWNTITPPFRGAIPGMTSSVVRSEPGNGHGCQLVDSEARILVRGNLMDGGSGEDYGEYSNAVINEEEELDFMDCVEVAVSGVG